VQLNRVSIVKPRQSGLAGDDIQKEKERKCGKLSWVFPYENYYKLIYGHHYAFSYAYR